MSDLLSRLLSEREILLADGAMATSLFELGLANGAPGELWNVEHPDRVRSIHRSFVDNGSDIILTNTFGGTVFRLSLHRLGDRVRELNIAAVGLAREAADGAGRPIVVGGSMGPTGDVLEPLGERTRAEAEEAYYEQAAALQEAGVDLAWIETMFSEEELDAAVRGAMRAGLPFVCTMSFDTGGRTMMGLKPAEAMRHSHGLPARPIAFGANCGVGPGQLLDSVLGMKSSAEPTDVIVAKANCGIPVLEKDGQIRYNGTPEVMAEYACMARDAGARIIGGCCGTTGAHVRAMAEALSARPRGPAPSQQSIERRFGPIKTTLGSIPVRTQG